VPNIFSFKVIIFAQDQTRLRKTPNKSAKATSPHNKKPSFPKEGSPVLIYRTSEYKKQNSKTGALINRKGLYRYAAKKSNFNKERSI
jgi:hypothetical protein